MTKTKIIKAAEDSFKKFSITCSSIKETDFFKRHGQKWSVAENMQHLIIATNSTTLAYSLPKFVVRWIGGKPNRPSKTFTELKEKYYKKLSEGGRAGGRFVPKPIHIDFGKQKILNNWNKAATKFIKAIIKNRTEEDLDNYLAKHPLLGRITLRELCYFTIFHTEHHLNSINKIVEPNDPVL